MPNQNFNEFSVKTDGTTLSVSSNGLKVSAGGIGNDEIAPNAITASKLAENSVGASEIQVGALRTGEIFDGTIINDDISVTAAIATTKLSGAVTDIPGHGLGGLATLSAIGTDEIINGTIENEDISYSAAIAGTKINPDFGSQNISTTGILLLRLLLLI